MSKRAAAVTLKKSKPLGAELRILHNDHAAVVSNTPVPDDVWDRLLVFNKAKVSGGTSATTQDKQICRLADKTDAETEYNLSWIGDAAKHGVEASALTLYIGEWMLRVEKGTIMTTPEVKAFMLALLAKLQRRSLDQLFKISQQTTNLRRNLILPLCGISGGRQTPIQSSDPRGPRLV